MKVFVAGSAGPARAWRWRTARPPRTWKSSLLAGRGSISSGVKARTDIAAFAPDAIINAAAYTAVDAAEQDTRARLRRQPGRRRVACRHRRATEIPFLHVSTDYVFDGTKTTPTPKTMLSNPQTAYGRTKRAGEEAVLTTCPSALVLRTAWVYSPYGQNFVKTMLRLARERDSLRVVNDQIGNPTSAHDMADALLAIAKRAVQDRDHPRGIYHLSPRPAP